MKNPFLSSIALSVTGLVFTTYLSMTSITASAAGKSSPAALLSFARVGNTLEFTVISTGCTQKDHFELIFLDDDSSEDNSNASIDDTQPGVNITLVRIKQDYCRRMPGPRIIQFELPEQQQIKGPIFISNPFTTLRHRTGK